MKKKESAQYVEVLWKITVAVQTWVIITASISRDGNQRRLVMKITNDQYWKLVGNVVQGIASNPTSGTISIDGYAIQSIVSTAINSVGQALMQTGVEIIEETPNAN